MGGMFSTDGDTRNAYYNNLNEVHTGDFALMG
jgi:hypothetical protein